MTHRFLPQFIGGVELYTLRLAHTLQELGHEVHILAGEPISRPDLSVEREETTYQGLPVTYLKYDYLRRSVIDRASYSDPLVTRHIQEIIQQYQPEIVHALSLSLLMGGTIEAAFRLDVPLIYTATDFVLTCRRGLYLKADNSICQEREALDRCTACMGPQTPLEKGVALGWQLTPNWAGERLLPLVENLIGKKADFVHAEQSIKHRLNTLSKWRQNITHIIALSSYMRDMFVLNDFPAEKITVSPSGVAVPEPLPEKIPSAKLRFGFFGRIMFIKGVHVLLEAFGQLSRPEAAQLTIYGGPDAKSKGYMQDLVEMAARWPNVSFAGAVEHTAISELYRDMDILIVPSIWPENSPITVLDALAHQVPVIASNIGGVADLVQHEVNGLIFSTGDAQDLAGQMNRCLDSPELVTRLTRNSRPIKSMLEDAHQIVALYQKIGSADKA